MDQPGVFVEQETDAARGWVFRVRIESEGATTFRTVSLSWVDHEYWSHGGSPPAHVVEMLVRFVLENGGLDRLGESFDAAAARRLHPSIDRELQGML